MKFVDIRAIPESLGLQASSFKASSSWRAGRVYQTKLPSWGVLDSIPNESGCWVVPSFAGTLQQEEQPWVRWIDGDYVIYRCSTTEEDVRLNGGWNDGSRPCLATIILFSRRKTRVPNPSPADL